MSTRNVEKPSHVIRPPGRCHVGFAWRSMVSLPLHGVRNSTLEPGPPAPLQFQAISSCSVGAHPAHGVPGGSPQSQWRRSRRCGPVPRGGLTAISSGLSQRHRFKLPWKRSPDHFCASVSCLTHHRVCSTVHGGEGCLNLYWCCHNSGC